MRMKTMDETTVTELVRRLIEEQAVLAWEKVIVQALDWPLLVFILILLFIALFHKAISERLARGLIEISWGEGKHIRLTDLSENIDQELDPIREELADLRERLADLSSGSPAAVNLKAELGPSEDERRTIKDRMYKALQSPKFKWRTVDGLATFCRTTPAQILELISEDQGIVLGTDKAGRRLAKLKSR